MAIENKGGPRAQAVARTIFPNTGGTIIGGIGSMVQTGPVQVAEQKELPRRVLPVDVIQAAFAAKVKLSPAMAAKIRAGVDRAAARRAAALAPTEPAAPVEPITKPE
jgi:hypothetical protein